MGRAAIFIRSVIRISSSFCYLEPLMEKAISYHRYQQIKYHPMLNIGDNVALSDLSHISCVDDISIGANCLIGSKVYLGDHNHARSLSNQHE